jgi:hypothetical protein
VKFIKNPEKVKVIREYLFVIVNLTTWGFIIHQKNALDSSFDIFLLNHPLERLCKTI